MVPMETRVGVPPHLVGLVGEIPAHRVGVLPVRVVLRLDLADPEIIVHTTLTHVTPSVF